MRRLLPSVLALAGVLTMLPAPGGYLGRLGPERNEPQARTALAQAALPAPPAGWPSTVELGMSDYPGGAAAMKATAPFGFRYQYLSGGANTGQGWATWNTNGDFATYYIRDSVANGIAPVFTYYQLLQSAPATGADEAAKDSSNLQNTATMTAYYRDLKLFFQKAGAFPTAMVVLHVEPDLWGYMQQRASGDNASTIPAKVAATGLPELAGLPDNLSGFARAVAKLRDASAPNVRLGYHLSVWGTGVDISHSDPSDAEVDALATRAANFYRSLQANFDLAFDEFSDRDSAFKVAQWQAGSQAWWDAADFRRNARFLGKFVSVAQKRIVMWQIPYGNTKMRATNNTWNHYQDNRVEWLLDDPSRSHLAEYVQAGVVAFLFGRGANGATCACDAAGDGVTNPAPINGNDRVSLTADDDGGFFRDRAKAYYATGPIALPFSSAGPTPTAAAATSTPTRTPTAAPTATPLPTSAPTATPTAVLPSTPAATATRTGSTTPSFTATARVSPTTVPRGQSVSISPSVSSATAMTVLVNVEVYSPSGQKVFQRAFDQQAFAAGQQRTYTVAWSVPSTAAVGAYTVKVGVFGAATWSPLHHWNDQAARFTVQ